jgi:hypothetical protein
VQHPTTYSPPLWQRLLSNHNPLYLVSAWLVLHGISQAFRGEVGLRLVPLMTQLLCGYILAIALAAWLVVRVGKIWDDARMILLVLLLMYTALSTSYDDLCLKNPAAGAVHLGFGFFFSCFITEAILFALGMKLPPRYRAPFYLQLAVLFAFPAILGRFSVGGRDPAMIAGVLLFPIAAGAALLTLLPAAASRPQRENGTPWPWPLYPWSIFVFMVIAFAIRAWMLTVSFSPAAGTAPAFLPYLLCPILLAMLVLALELGLRHQSKVTQCFALMAMLGIAWLAFPGERPNDAQRLLLDLMQDWAAAPPLIVCAAVALVAAYAIVRRAAGSELVALVAMLLLACLERDTRGLHSMVAPNESVLMALVAWQFGYGLWHRSTPRLAFAGTALTFVLGQHYDWSWLFAHDAFWLVQIAAFWCLLLPLYCRDAFANELRAGGPAMIIVAGTGMMIAACRFWWPVTARELAIIATGILAVAVVYWIVLRVRWYALATGWGAVLTVVTWTSTALSALDNLQLRHGLIWYACGCFLLLVAFMASCWKAGLARRAWQWLQSTAEPPTGRPPSPVSSNSA